jgi:hypothetical protein
LIDRFLPRFDLAVVHARVFRVPPQMCYQAARGLDFFRAALIRTLIGLRGLPQPAGLHRTGHRGRMAEEAVDVAVLVPV